MIRAIAFDIDNSILDFRTFKEKTARAAASAMVKHGFKINAQFFQNSNQLVHGKPHLVKAKAFRVLFEVGEFKEKQSSWPLALHDYSRKYPKWRL